MNTKINQEISKILKKFGDKYYIDEVLNKSKVIQDLDNYDESLIESLLSSELIKKNFTLEIADNIIIQQNKLIQLFEMDEYWQDSYTKFSKKIGLLSNGKFIDETDNVVVSFPYKDTVLKASMSKEEINKNDLLPNEPFLNTIIAKDEIDVLFDKKILSNVKKYDSNGGQEVRIISENDNLIIKGNNLLALYTIKDRYVGKVKLIYIDPPYNTSGDSFVYNDSFSHSTWLTFMYNRLEIAKEFLREDGVIFIQCDDNEQAYLKVLCDEIFGRNNFINNLSVVMNLKGNQDQFAFAGTHEYILVYAKSKEQAKFYNLEIDDLEELNEWEEDSIGLYKKGANLKATGVNAPREKRPNLFFPIYVNKKNNQISLEKREGYDVVVLPITEGKEMSWRWQKSTFEKNISDVIITENNGSYSFYKKQRPEIGDLPSRKPKTLFYKPKYSSGNGTNQIKALFGEKVFSFPKPEELIKDIITISTVENDLVLDFFMGSATTQAVSHKLNRQYIGIEQMDYIKTVSVPRLLKVIEGEQGGISKDVNWKGGGSFIYVELMEKNMGFLKTIVNAETKTKLKETLDFMLEEAEIDFKIDLENLKNDFHTLTLNEQKKILIQILEKNQLYYNYSEIDDENIRNLINENDYYFNKSFYSEGGE